MKNIVPNGLNTLCLWLNQLTRGDVSIFITPYIVILWFYLMNFPMIRSWKPSMSFQRNIGPECSISLSIDCCISFDKITNLASLSSHHMI
jgi:hypothetical protein